MKTITLWDPWASLIALGEKKIETRSWKTNYRGPLAIHAAKRYMDKIAWEEPFYSALEPLLDHAFPHVWVFHPGCIVATCNLVGCYEINAQDPIHHIANADAGDHYIVIDGNEYYFGDYTPRRYAWMLSDIKAIVPIPAKGFQRLWNWEERREEDMEGRTK